MEGLKEQTQIPPRLETYSPPLHSVEDIFSLVNPDIRKPLPMLDVIHRIVDGSSLSIFKPRYGPNMITARASIYGRSSCSESFNHAYHRQACPWL